ncbi:sensor histidine kinase [Paenibacillus wulumuqiensis]|uniref:sensor histidine kinase n=1 Tax=Paenibacillus wulumuqiensis TaxID=1567107 RepID=UPI000A52D1F9|nr:sensor histidine kinase [Paenibacillus wulumuqiensis]
MWTNAARWFKDMSFKKKLLLSHLLLACLIILSLGFIYNHIAYKDRMDNIRFSTSNILHTNNQLLDDRLSAIESSMSMLPLDYDLLRAVDAADPTSASSLVRTDRLVTPILFKYFSNHEEVYSSYVMTREYGYGSNALMYVPPAEFYHSLLAQAAAEGRGAEVWIPTYSYTGMYKQEDLRHIPLEYESLISVVKQLNMTAADEYGNIHRLKANQAPPVLLINIRPESLAAVLDEYVQHNDYNQLAYGMVNRAGVSVLRLEKGDFAHTRTAELPAVIGSQEQGMVIQQINGQDTMVFYEKMKSTGWISYIEIPIPAAVSSLQTLQITTALFLLSMALVSVVLAYMLSSYITRPLTRIKQGIRQVEKGQFDIRIQPDSRDEFGQLTEMFNEMNRRIEQLIEENYGSRLRARESEIMALNLQLNPHFLYNTLSTMYWIAMEHGQHELARMMISLTEMLQITTRNKQELWKLETDLSWLDKYIYIMQNRFENKFTVEMDVEEELFDTEVPKLFLQPFIENAIIHGFGEMESGGRLRIRGWLEGEERMFAVEDNGKGITHTLMDDIQTGEIRSTGIENVDRRIRLLYGPEYGIHMQRQDSGGTLVLIRLPHQHSPNENTPIQ